MPKKIKVNTKKKGTIWDIPNSAKKGHDGTVKMVNGVRNAKNKMPGPIKRLFPDF